MAISHIQTTVVIADLETYSEIHSWSGTIAATIAPINGVPLIWHTITQLHGAGFTQIIVATRSTRTIEAIGRCSDNRIKIEFVHPDILDGRLGPLFAAARSSLAGAVLFISANTAISSKFPWSSFRDSEENLRLDGSDSKPVPESDTGPDSFDLRHCAICSLGLASVERLIGVLDQSPSDLDGEIAALTGNVVTVHPNSFTALADAVDLEIANFLSSPDDVRFERLSAGSGGYWSRPVREHLLLCNNFFPPKVFFDRLGNRLQAVLRLYPSAQGHVAKQVGDMTGHAVERVAVGNGVADLIQALYSVVEPVLAIPTPTFDGFQIAVPPERVNCFELPEPNFDLDVDAFAEFASKNRATLAVVVNPNNPSGRLVDGRAIRRLAQKLRAFGCRLVVDESFIDFPDGGPAHSLEPHLLDHPNLIVMKSLGKIWGLGGVRLGYMLTADTDLVALVRQRLPMWNVNGVAEYTLWLIPEFQNELRESLERIRMERDWFENALRKIDGMTVVPSSTNYVLSKLPPNWPSGSSLKRLLATKYNTLIRECSYQTMRDSDRYIRLTVRSRDENAELIKILLEAAATVGARSSNTIGGSGF
ncbi:aminotransferase class I/II-fold pyridoxal phosphate-dependent enzyme [Sinorhizobium medicae]|uniref:pyridoxal phosphate-dependent aminotransferase n=1 Tax=Sinorhizobium medicae TaxID=110321 RepID=UPI0012972489|nr:histidinol-phosphate transaminase [Sinorhizobium medicae]MDX0414779.1 aminotransferase class I/II-fold pyridoxal phosphate-dependent enzyme [Sinorhizobium medicae]MDX0469410.1 aminotransferase class I/II-fold pyridoxal phosphate-dependent enzyme [Sinorhizobium medicae]MDX0475733.1 aminotransferase class I/II-fold pyridoxal phosphate-dependent enzyme [Sinorhizobium medicae]MDX0900945.1 aminotransferase class I/II-fold pyridoxal phosphate-dependent enzyme [Sinorhizobium medicae]MDX1176556.1 a